MSEERIPQFITAYRALYQQNSSAYLRRVRFSLILPNVVVGGFALLLSALWLAGTFAVARFQDTALLFLLLFAAALSLPLVRIFSFRRALRTAPNIYLTERQRPSARDAILFGLIGFMLLAGTASASGNVYVAHIVLALFSSAFLFYVFRVHFFLKETLRYYACVPAADGRAVPTEAEVRLRDEYSVCADRAPGAPSIDGVFLTNVADVQIGPVVAAGKKRGNSLSIGLPLLQAVTPQQFRAFLLSECLSWSFSVGRLYHRCVDRYVAWNRLLFNLTDTFHWGRRLYRPLNDAIYSRLTAHVFLLSRIACREADRGVADLGLLAPLQDALANQAYKHRLFEKSVWPDIYRQADGSGVTTLEPFTAIQGELSGEHDREEAKLVLNESMVPWRDSMPLVPPPSERLAMLQVNPFVPEREEESAADYFFGERLGEVLGAADTSWSCTFFDTYGELLARRREARDELENVLAIVAVCGEERKKEQARLLWRAGQIRGGLAEEDADLDAALDLYLRAVAADPDSAPARLAAARVLLNRHDSQGLAMLDPILRAEAIGEERIHAHTMVLEYMRGKGMEEEVKAFEAKHLCSFNRARESVTLYRRHAEEERRRIEPHDNLVSHELDDAALRHVLRVLERYPHVAAATLARKEVRYLPEYPFYLLGLEIERPPSRGFLDPGGPVLYAQRIAEELQFLRGGIGVVLLNDIDHISAQLRSVPDSMVYRRVK